MNQIAFQMSRADYSCQIDAFTAYHELKKNNTLLIDIRSKNSYQKISIPDSLNIPLFRLKTKNILKNKKLFLIDDGGRLNNIAQLCYQLKEKGFKIFYITGGLNAWSKLKKGFLGSAKELIQLDELGAEHFYFDNDIKDLVIINIGKQQNKILKQTINSSPIANYYFIPYKQNSRSLLKKLKQIVKQQPKVTRVFIYDEAGKTYSAFKKHLKEQLKASVFYLNGGYKAFERFELFRLALSERQKIKPNPFFSCRG
ncbi:MAG: rhodanese-like domain-containing protein [Pseudomonadota bacterium]